MYWCLILTIVSAVEQISWGEKTKWKDYGGESFPTKYLSPDGNIVTSTDMDYYIKNLFRPLAYFNEAPNETDVSGVLCAFYTQSIMKRTIKDNGTKLQKNQTDSLKKIQHMSENIVSHYTYKNGLRIDWDDMEFRVSKLFISDESQVHSIGDFNRNRLRRWILTKDNNMNEYLEAMDKATMAKEVYGYLTDANPDDKYFVGMYTSDMCVSRIVYNGEPIVPQMRKCKTDRFCEKPLYSNPSIGYYLSHRFVNVYLRISKGCYIRSELEDRELMDQMCGNMYREAVYLARRGYFARDLFLELIALCGMLGYEEFHRTNWFYKASSWINQHGCVVEDRNFIKNRTKFLKIVTGVRQRRAYYSYFCKQLKSECEEHPTALVMVVLAHGIRHAAKFINGN